MTTRDQLEEILATQRTRRLKFPAPRKRGRNLLSMFAAVAIVVISAAAMFFAVDITTLKTNNIASPSVGIATAFVVSPSPRVFTAITAAHIVRQVCTDIPDGRLHVRFAAGDGSEVRGYLVEGETVQIMNASDNELEEQIMHGELWSRISFPVVGWVNARYLCISK